MPQPVIKGMRMPELEKPDSPLATTNTAWRFPSVHPEGRKFLLIAAVVTLVVYGGVSHFLGWICVGLTLWIAAFFRDPIRTPPADANLIVAPADGLITTIAKVPPPPEIAGPSGLQDTEMTRISIFMSVFDVHINRSPVSGRVRKMVYVPGKFLNADLDKASEENERQHFLVESASGALESLTARVVEQNEASQRMASEIGRAVAELEQRFAAVAESGDAHAGRFVEALGNSRAELEALSAQSDAHNESMTALIQRTGSLQAVVERLTGNVRAQLAEALDQAASQTEHLVNSTRSVRPEIDWIREAAVEASDRLGQTGAAIAGQQDSLTALLGTLEEGVGQAESRLSALSSAISQAQGEAAELTAETGPALVQALVQVKEAAAQAAERAREAIASVIPDSAEGLSQATRDALERVISDSIEERLRDVEAVAARAVESARSATDRLTHQMLVLGQSATALEQHLEKQQEDRRESDSETFARRVSLLIDSMHSASIDVGKILSDEVDDKAWDAYLKGDRGVFTRRAARLIGGSEAKAIRAHYETDGEFQQSVNRYIHDFEAMLRRVIAERDGGMIAVTIMSSDMGKLYAALSDALDRRR